MLKGCREPLNGATKNRGMAHQHLNSYLVEFMWRQKHNNILICILNCMAEHFPTRVNY